MKKNLRNLLKSSLLSSCGKAINPGRKTARVILFSVQTLLIFSCSAKKEEGTKQNQLSDKKIAKVFGREIYYSELKPFIREDSAGMVTAYINKVIQEEALLRKADDIKDVDLSDIDKKVQEFRNSLIILKYQEQYFKQNLDTAVADSVLKNYYNRNSTMFRLSQDIFRGYYIVVPAGTPKTERLRTLMVSSKTEDIQELKSFCMRYASTFSINADSWSIFPNNSGNSKHVSAEEIHKSVQNRQVLTFEKEDHVYFIRFIDYKTSRQISPYEFCRNEVRNVILNKRKMKAWAQLKELVLKEAINEHHVEIYK